MPIGVRQDQVRVFSFQSFSFANTRGMYNIHETALIAIFTFTLNVTSKPVQYLIIAHWLSAQCLVLLYNQLRLSSAEHNAAWRVVAHIHTHTHTCTHARTHTHRYNIYSNCRPTPYYNNTHPNFPLGRVTFLCAPCTEANFPRTLQIVVFSSLQHLLPLN